MSNQTQIKSRLLLWLKAHVLDAVIFGAALLLSVSHMVNYKQMSPIDELRHLDYVISVTRGQIPNLGDKLQQTSMREEACRGIDLAGWKGPPCHRPILKPEQFRDDGWQTASAHPPTYYVIAAGMSESLKTLGATHTYLDGARATSALLSAVGLVIVFRVGRRMKLSAFSLAATCVAYSTSSVYLHQSSIVTPDSVSILVGSLAVYSLVRYLYAEISFKWVVATAALAGFTKLTNLLVVLVLVGAVLFYQSTSFQLNLRERLLRSSLILVSGFGVAGAWVVLDTLRRTIDPAIVPQNQMLATDGIPSFSHLIASEHLFRWLPPINSYLSAEFTTPLMISMLMFLSVVLLGSLVIKSLNSNRKDLMSIMASATFIVALIGAPSFVVVNAVVNSVLINAESRYGLVIAPIFLLTFASQVKNKIGEVLVCSFSTLLWLGAVVAIWT